MARRRTFTVPAIATILEPNSEKFRAVAAQHEERFGFKLHPQIDLMYVESCLVTVGMNDNDDCFLKDELWKARYTPVVKPSNWQHQEKEILGVTYSVQARDLNGNVIPFDQVETPDGPFELFTEAVVYKLIHPERAKEIEDRFAKGNLYVSMEAWFDSYDYVVVDDNNMIQKVLAHNKETAFMDQILKVNGGVGRHNGQRIGRGLRDITFGGYGFVDRPANKRSDITDVAEMVRADGLGDEGQLNELLRKFMSVVQESQPTEVALTQETELMTATAGSNESKLDREAVNEVVVAALAKHENAKEARAAKAALESKTQELVTANENLSGERDTAQASIETKDEEIATLTKRHENVLASMEDVIKILAGATGDTPPEVSKIDSASDGDAAFAAKMSWIQNSLKTVASAAERAQELEEELATAAVELRAEEIRGLFKGLATDQEIDALVTIGTSYDTDESYDLWLKEKQWVAARLTDQSGTEAKIPDAFKKGKDKDKAKEDEKSEANKAVDALLSNTPAGVKFAQDDLGISSGLNAGQIRVPRHKVAGSADGDPDETLANAKPDDKGVDLASAGQGENSGTESKPAMRVLAEELFPKDEEGEKSDD